MDEREYSDVSRDDVAKIRGELGKFGIAIPDGDDVEVAGPLGVKMRVTYNQDRGSLRLAITDKPAFISRKQIWKVIEGNAGALRGKSSSEAAG